MAIRPLILRLTVMVLTVLPMGIIPVATYARSDREQHTRQQERGNTISSSKAAAIAKSRYGGKVLKVKKSGSVYRVKLLQPSGHVKQVVVDGNTGRVIGR